MSLTHAQRALRNGSSHFAAVLVNVLTGFVLLPAIVRGLGVTDFGIWAVSTTLVGYAALLDLGLGQTLVKKTSEFLAQERWAELQRTVSTVFTLYLLLGLVVLAVFGAFAYLSPWIFRVPEERSGTLQATVAILGLVAAISLPMATLTGIIGGLQDFHFTNLVSAGLNLLKAGLTLWLLANGQGLIALVTLGAIISMVGWMAAAARVRRRIPNLRLGIDSIDRSSIRFTLRFSGSMFVWSLAGQALQTVDRLVLGILFSVKLAGLYEVGARLNAYSRYAINVVFVAVPAASALESEGRHAELRRLYLRGTKAVVALYAAIATGFLLVGPEFVSLWMGPGFEDAVVVAQVLMLGSLYQSQNSMGHVVLVGIGKLRTFTLIMAMYPILLVAFAAGLGLAYGVVGVAGGVLITILLLESVFLVHLASVTGVGLRELVSETHLRIIPCAIASGCVLALLKTAIDLTDWMRLGACVAAFGVTYAVLLWRVGLSSDERAGLSRSLRAWGLVRPQRAD